MESVVYAMSADYTQAEAANQKMVQTITTLGTASDTTAAKVSNLGAAVDTTGSKPNPFVNIVPPKEAQEGIENLNIRLMRSSERMATMAMGTTELGEGFHHLTGPAMQVGTMMEVMNARGMTLNMTLTELKGTIGGLGVVAVAAGGAFAGFKIGEYVKEAMDWADSMGKVGTVLRWMVVPAFSLVQVAAEKAGEVIGKIWEHFQKDAEYGIKVMTDAELKIASVQNRMRMERAEDNKKQEEIDNRNAIEQMQLVDQLAAYRSKALNLEYEIKAETDAKKKDSEKKLYYETEKIIGDLEKKYADQKQHEAEIAQNVADQKLKIEQDYADKVSKLGMLPFAAAQQEMQDAKAAAQEAAGALEVFEDTHNEHEKDYYFQLHKLQQESLAAEKRELEAQYNWKKAQMQQNVEDTKMAEEAKQKEFERTKNLYIAAAYGTENQSMTAAQTVQTFETADQKDLTPQMMTAWKEAMNDLQNGTEKTAKITDDLAESLARTSSGITALGDASIDATQKQQQAVQGFQEMMDQQTQQFQSKAIVDASKITDDMVRQFGDVAGGYFKQIPMLAAAYMMQGISANQIAGAMPQQPYVSHQGLQSPMQIRQNEYYAKLHKDEWIVPNKDMQKKMDGGGGATTIIFQKGAFSGSSGNPYVMARAIGAEMDRRKRQKKGKQ